MHIPDPTAATPPNVHARDLLVTLVADAQRFFQQKNPRQCAQSLTTAESTAKQHHLHREAAELRQALKILAQGGSPKLLRRGLSSK